MALGKAFIEVHADTKPFARELAAELNKIIKAAEKTVKVDSHNLGQSISNNVGQGIKKNSNKLGQTITKAVNSGFGSNLGTKFTQGIIDSLDDGLSGLPAEVKAALGAALVAILPFIAGAVTSLVNATVVAAFAGLGFLIASQFQVVQDQWQMLVGSLRDLLGSTGVVFVQPVLDAFTLIRERLFSMEGWFKEVFAAASQFIIPVTNALLNFIEGLLPGLLDTLRNSTTILDDLEAGFYTLGRVVGQALKIISGSQYADEGFRDLLFVLGSLILSFALFIRVLTEVYGRLRDIALLLSGPGGIARVFAESTAERYANGVKNAADANGLFGDSLKGLLAPTEDEEQAIAALNQQISKLEQLTLAQVNNDIAWEQALADFTASVKENGKSLKLNSQEGRNNARALVELAQVALRTRADQIALTGDVANAQVEFEKQRATIYNLAKQMGLSAADTETLIGALLRIPPPRPSGVDQATINRLIYAISLAKGLGSALGLAGAIGIQVGAGKKYAEGGIVSRPHLGLVGEDGPEAIIPLNKPARAQQLMNQAGLTGMGGPVVNVYIGNDQIDAYIDARQVRNNTMTARSLAYGSRGM